MLVTQYNRIYTNIGDFCFLEKNIKSYVDLKFMLKDYTFTPYLSFTELHGVDNVAITLASGMHSTLPGNYLYHTSVDDVTSISSIREGDEILLAGAYPDVDIYFPVRVPHSLCEAGYFEVTEPVAEILAAACYYGIKTDKGLIIKDIDASLISDEAILFIKNFGAVVLKNIINGKMSYTIRVVGNEFTDFLTIDDSILIYIISNSPRSVISSFFKIRQSIVTDAHVFESNIYTIQQMLLSRFGLVGQIKGNKLHYDHDIDLSDIKPMYERYSNTLKVNDALSLYRDKVVKVEKLTGTALNLLLDSQSNSRLLLDNIF